MCRFKTLVNVAPIVGLIQSLLWMIFGLLGGLTYLCVVPVPPYEKQTDFFRVSLVKFYFEGPKCIPDGSYLGRFNVDYRKQMELFPPDRVFAAMVAYVLLNAFYFVLSVTFCRSRKEEGKRGLAVGWSVTTLFLCALDLALTYAFAIDIFTLRDYLNSASWNMPMSLADILYVSLAMALLSSRFVVIWLWNFIVGFLIFCNAVAFGSDNKKTPQPMKQVEEKKQEELVRRGEDVVSSFNVMKGNFQSNFDVKYHPNFFDDGKSTGGTTSFYKQNDILDGPWSYTTTRGYLHPKFRSSKGLEMLNEGYVSDDPLQYEKNYDFEGELKNFEPGQRKIKIVKPPIGKPVSIPVPPPLPPNSSCHC